MKKNIYTVALAIGTLMVASSPVSAQAPPRRSCGSMDVLKAQLAADPSYASRLQAIDKQAAAYTLRRSSQQQRTTSAIIVTIPVVVHVLYNTSAQNISDAQVQSQIDVLNSDYHKLNADRSKVPSAFSGLIADAGVQFVLAKRDPNGLATTGVIHKSTSATSFDTSDKMKFSSQGGDDAWPATAYLNLWVCNLGGGLLGYAQFPGGAAATDGVAILYSSFGSGGSAVSPYNLGRTATHEVGHWLNLRHIWGDANCGDDMVSDTPTQQTSNFGCPVFPHVTCSNGSNGDMFMNYMDYVDDACMQMFSSGQGDRMDALFASGGVRVSLLTSSGGVAPGSTPPPSTSTYCASQGSSVAYEYLALVNLGSINRSSGADGGYYDGTALATSVAQGSAQTVSYAAGFVSSAYTENVTVYIDWNQNGSFADAGETVASGTTATTTPQAATFTVPAGAKTGKTRMRVVLSDNAATTSCGAYSYGETEDYSVTVTTGGTPPPSIIAYCTSQGSSQAYEYLKLVQLGSINRSSGADGGYYNGTATSTSVAAGSSQTISYQTGFTGSGYAEYFRIYADWNQNGTFDAGETLVSSTNTAVVTGVRSATFTVPATARNGATRLRVVMSDNAATGACGSYSYGETEDYTVSVTGGTRVASASVRSVNPNALADRYILFPNPVTDVLSITRPLDVDPEQPFTVRVYDLRGAEIKGLTLAAGQLNVSVLHAGIYLLLVNDGTTISHQRFVKE